MARVLPSGRVFGEAVALPQIGFAKEAHPMETLQKAATSDLAGLAVAGISRIKDEIDYADRLDAEKRRVAGAQIAERKAQAAHEALFEQMERRGEAVAAARQIEAQKAAEAERIAEEQERADLRWLQSGAPEAIDYSRDVVDALGRHLGHTPTAGQPPFAARGMDLRQQFLAGLSQAEDPAAYYAAWKAQQGQYDPYVAASQTAPRAGEALMSPQYETPTETPPPIPEMVTPEQLEESQARLAAAQKAAAVPMQFVPKTMADFRFKVRDLETRAMQAETAEEKQALVNQIRQTISQARGAVDMQPEGLMEAITGEAGKEAQRKAYKEMTTTEKEFLRQMYDASKERRAEAREGRAVSAEARAQEKHDKTMEEVGRKARARARWLASGGKTKRAALVGLGSSFLRHSGDYKAKRGIFSDEAIMAETGGPMAESAVEQVREERWRRLTTLPDGTSVSGENAGSLIATLRSLGMSKKDESALSSGVVTLRQQDAASLKRRQRLEDLEAKKREAIDEAMAGIPDTPPSSIVKEDARQVWDAAFNSHMENKDWDDDDDLREAGLKAAAAARAVLRKHYPALGEGQGGEAVAEDVVPGRWNKESMKAYSDRYGTK